MLKTTEGIIFKTIKYGESSVILDIFSPDDGLNSYIIGGVRRKKSKKASVVQVLNIVDFVAYFKNSEKLNRIKEIQLNTVYIGIPFNVIKSSLALFLLEMCRKSLRGSDQYESVYRYIKSQFVKLDQYEGSLAHFHIHFLIKLAALIGFEINNNYSATTPFFNLQDGTFEYLGSNLKYTLSKEVSYFLHIYLNEQEPTEISKTERKQILNGLVGFYRYHIDDFEEIKSLEVLNELYG